MGLVAFVGKVLRIALTIARCLHGHIFVAVSIAMALCFQDHDPLYSTAIPNLIGWGPAQPLTACLAVYLMNGVGDLYSEIQSWQVSYILWSACTCIGLLSQEVYACMLRQEHRQKAEEAVNAAVLRPFGLTPVAGNSGMWIMSLVALAPALVGGFIANSILDERYQLECKDAYNSFSDICQHGVCCIVVSSHQNTIDFLTKLASSILAAWGIVKIVGWFIIAHDASVKAKDQVAMNTSRNLDRVASTSP